MGKTRRLNIRLRSASNPLGITLRNAINYDEESADGPIVSLRDQLLSPNIEEKVNGLQSFAFLVADNAKVNEIVRTDIVRIAAPFLCSEKNLALRNATAGALRNLSVVSADVCEWLVEQDVMTPLLALLNEYIRDEAWIPKFDNKMRDQLDLKSDIFLQAVNILWNLCESTPTALDLFNQSSLLEGLIRCLNYKVFGLDITISTAQCLLVVSENNPKSWIALNDNIQTLICLLDAFYTGGYGHAYLSALSAGILNNVPALAAGYTTSILNVLSQILGSDHIAILKENLSTLPTEENNKHTVEFINHMDVESEETEEEASIRRRLEELPTDADKIIEDISYLLDAQRLAAEIIANLCSTDEEYVDREEEELSENESVVDISEDKLSDSSSQFGDKMSVEALEILKSGQVIAKLWAKIEPISDELFNLLRENASNLIMKVKNLRISALLCLQNLCNSLTLEDMGGADNLYSAWVDLGQKVFKGPQDISILEPSTTLMRSGLDKLKHNKGIFKEMSSDDLELMVNGITKFSMPEIRANWLRMLGTLGCILESETLVKTIILCILKICQEEEDAWTISEGLDSLMDIFADDLWNKLIADLKLVKQSKEMEVILKTKLRRQKRELKDRYSAVQTVCMNFSRFVSYLGEVEASV